MENVVTSCGNIGYIHALLITNPFDLCSNAMENVVQAVVIQGTDRLCKPPISLV